MFFVSIYNIKCLFSFFRHLCALIYFFLWYCFLASPLIMWRSQEGSFVGLQIGTLQVAHLKVVKCFLYMGASLKSILAVKAIFRIWNFSSEWRACSDNTFSCLVWCNFAHWNLCKWCWSCYLELVMYLLVFFWNRAFIQAVLLMSVFEQRLSFWMDYFKKNHHKVSVKCR